MSVEYQVPSEADSSLSVGMTNVGTEWNMTESWLLFRADLELFDLAIGHDSFPDVDRL